MSSKIPLRKLLATKKEKVGPSQKEKETHVEEREEKKRKSTHTPTNEAVSSNNNAIKTDASKNNRKNQSNNANNGESNFYEMRQKKKNPTEKKQKLKNQQKRSKKKEQIKEEDDDVDIDMSEFAGFDEDDGLTYNEDIFDDEELKQRKVDEDENVVNNNNQIEEDENEDNENEQENVKNEKEDEKVESEDEIYFDNGEEDEGEEKEQEEQEKEALTNLVSEGANPSAVVFIANFPHGFYEKEMEGFFSQFGPVLRVRLSRKKKNGRVKGYGWIEFEHQEIAKVAVEAMHNYIMYGRRLCCRLMNSEQIHPNLFKNAGKPFNVIDWKQRYRDQYNQKKDREEEAQLLERNQKKREKKLKAKGIEYDFEITIRNRQNNNNKNETNKQENNETKSEN